MKRHLVILAIGCLCIGMSATADDKADDAAPALSKAAAQDVHDVIFLGESRPVFVRIHVLVDEKPLNVVWNDFIKKIFDAADADHDGVLSKEELKKVPSPDMLFSNAFVVNFTAPRFEQLDTNHDGTVSRNELAEFYRRNRGGPFHLTAGTGQPAMQRVVRVGGAPPTPGSEAMNNVIFALLDSNKDGKISREELRAAPEVLMTLDRNEDEMVSAQEIMPVTNQAIVKVDQAAAVAKKRVGPETPTVQLSIVAVEPGMPMRNLAARLQSKYAPKGAKAGAAQLSRQDLGLDEATFAKLDADGNGTLDTEELARFTQRAPDIELTMRLGKYSGDAKPVIGHIPADNPLASAIEVRREFAALTIGTTRLELRASARTNTNEFEINRKQFYENQFNNADGDNNGYIDKEEAEQNPFFKNAFAMMDADGDGMIYKQEMFAYVAKVQDLQKAATNSCASLAVSDQGGGLFEMIDTKKDGKLSIRELREAAKVLATLDADGDGFISRAEIPRSHVLALNRGNGNTQPTDRVVAVAMDGRMPQAAPPLPEGPLWFRKMDRNRDGDVSRREFLGSDEEFQKIDTDGDGLISLQEAKAYDAKMRTQKSKQVDL